MMRTLKKTASWSLIAFLVTATVTYAITGDPVKAGWIAVLCRAIKFFAYLWHEKWWAIPAATLPPALPYVSDNWPEDWELESRRSVYDAATGRHVALPNYTPAQLASDCC